MATTILRRKADGYAGGFLFFKQFYRNPPFVNFAGEFWLFFAERLQNGA